MNELINYYANELRKIYDDRTAGDHTFEGVLAEFFKDAKEKIAKG